MNKNIYVLFTARDGWTHEDLVAIDKLPYPKRILVNRHFDDIKSAVYVEGFDDLEDVGILSEYISDWRHIGHKYYDFFDYVSFLNSK